VPGRGSDFAGFTRSLPERIPRITQIYAVPA
jgi:hypothetical protein